MWSSPGKKLLTIFHKGRKELKSIINLCSFFVPNAAFLKVVKILFVALRCCLLLGEFKENIVVLSYLMNELSGRMHYNAECGLLYKWWFLVLQTTRRVYWCYYADQRAHQTGKFEFFSRFVRVVHCLMRLDLTRKPLCSNSASDV